MSCWYIKRRINLSLCTQLFLGFTTLLCSESEWGSTSTVLMLILYWSEQMNDMKFQAFATKHKVITYCELLIHSDDCMCFDLGLTPTEIYDVTWNTWGWSNLFSRQKRSCEYLESNISRLEVWIQSSETISRASDLLLGRRTQSWFTQCVPKVANYILSCKIYTAKNAINLLQIVDFTCLLQVVHQLQQVCWIHQVAASLWKSDLLPLDICRLAASCWKRCERILISAWWHQRNKPAAVTCRNLRVSGCALKTS